MGNPPRQCDADQTANPADNPPPPRQVNSGAAVNEQPHRQSGKHSRCRKLRKAPIWIEASCAVVLVGITGYYTHYAALQHSAMVESNRINREALETVQRAFISLNNFDAKIMTEPTNSFQMSEVTFYPFWKNSGTTPGVKAKDYDNAITMKSTLPEDFAFPDHDPVSGKERPAGSEGTNRHIMYYPPQAVTGAHPLWFNREQVTEFQANRLHLYMYGWTKYHDVFNDTPEHVTMFCYEVTRIVVIPPTPATPPPTNLLVSMEQCSKHNCVDDTCKGEPGY
jgi:hypothetical protein